MIEPAFFHVLTDDTRLLAVDDDPIQREFASVYLSSPNASVRTAPDGRTALDILARETFDIALLDIDMPGLSGFDVLAAIRRDPRTQAMPVVVVTGREDIASIDRAYNLGATSFANKPVNWRMLAYQIRYVLRASRTSAAPVTAVAA